MLNFPYKDCILKGTQSKDEVKSDEIFFNEILGSDEIDVLFKPKVLQNFELISPSLADGDKGGELKSTKNNSAKFLNSESTHPLAPSAREGELPKNEFIYCELMPLNALYKARITQSQNDSELARIYKDLEQKAFINYRVDIKALLKDKDFESLDLESKKQILCEILDSNMDYVPYGDMEDSSYGVDREIIELNKAFYWDL